jgi:tRNA A37 threonylcarbamoyladenosine modification protein TsaB
MLTVGISTSSGQFALVIGEGGKLLFDSTAVPFPAWTELAERLTRGLQACGRETGEVGNLIVDTGPGGTSRVRTGVSFANGLAYALGVTVCPVSSMELAGLDAWAKHRLPVIHTVKSIKGNAYAGLADGERLHAMEYGPLEEILARLTRGEGAYAVTGYHREEVLRWGEAAGGVTLLDSGQAYGEARFLIEQEERFIARALKFPAYACPITEQTL